jgi:acyl-CoA synthetase (NDP forming)
LNKPALFAFPPDLLASRPFVKPKKKSCSRPDFCLNIKPDQKKALLDPGMYHFRTAWLCLIHVFRDNGGGGKRSLPFMGETTEHFKKIDRLFHPRSIAVVGEPISAKIGPGFMEAHVNQGFPGKLYAINPKGRVRDYETYPSLMEVPGPVDHVIISVPAKVLQQVIEDCVQKNVRSAAIFTSGFREWDEEKGAEKEAEILNIAKKGGLRLIGPNCMGFYCPRSGLSYRADMPVRKDGKISIISQSGGVAMTPVYAAAEKGIGFAKSISYGNEVDLGAVDWLLYLAEDPDTEIICMYIEGTGEGQALRNAMETAAKAKPLLVIKGGRTDSGARAVSSHTGAMAGSQRMWEAVCRQTGAILVHDIGEMLDVAKLLLCMKRPAGKRVGLVSVSGGLGVMYTDLFTLNGFEIPKFSESLRNDLKQWVDLPGTSIRNPLDMATAFFSMEKHPPMFARLGQENNLDIIAVVLAMEYLSRGKMEDGELTTFLLQILAESFDRAKKPLVVIFPETKWAKTRLDMENFLMGRGYPVFSSVEACTRALNHVFKKHHREEA